MKSFFSLLKRSLISVFQVLIFSTGISVLLYIVFMSGFSYGFYKGTQETKEEIKVSSTVVKAEPTPTPRTIVVNPRTTSKPDWSGPELWDEVNKRRQELGVNSLANVGELCTIASIRLNELLDLGKLDGHEGFSNLAERRPDLKWIFEKYNISEFLVSGATTASEAVALWENTLGHKKLLTGGEYVWGCTYAQAGFGVAIAAY